MLKENTWNIFDIAKENNVDIGVGMDMFVANLDRCAVPYHGADGLDYSALGEDWSKLTAEEKTAAKNAYSDFTRENYDALTATRRAGDKDAFERIVKA